MRPASRSISSVLGNFSSAFHKTHSITIGRVEGRGEKHLPQGTVYFLNAAPQQGRQIHKLYPGRAGG